MGHGQPSFIIISIIIIIIINLDHQTKLGTLTHSFKIRSGQVDLGSGRSGAGTGPSWRKNRKRKNPKWLGDPVDPTRPVNFYFFYWNDVVLILKKFNPSNLVIWSKSSDPVKTLNTNGILRYILIFFFKINIYK